MKGLEKLLLQLLHVLPVEWNVRTWGSLWLAQRLGTASGIAEITADGFLNLPATVHQPKDDEECHHCGHKVRIRDLPGASMVSPMRGALFDDDDFWRTLHNSPLGALCGGGYSRTVFLTAGLLDLLETRASVFRYCAAGHLDRKNWGHPFDEGKHDHA